MKKIAIAVAALTAGGLIYVIWRPESLLMFSWFDRLGIGSAIGSIRQFSDERFPLMRGWILNSLPHALWLFSGLLCLHTIWGRHEDSPLTFWCSVLVSIAVLSEIAQLGHLLPGTFDIGDLVGMVAACTLAYVVLNQPKRKERSVYK